MQNANENLSLKQGISPITSSAKDSTKSYKKNPELLIRSTDCSADDCNTTSEYSKMLERSVSHWFDSISEIYLYFCVLKHIPNYSRITRSEDVQETR